MDLETQFPEEFNPVQNIENSNVFEESKPKHLSLTTSSSKKKSIFAFENLSPWYVLAKRVRLALYKLFIVLPNFLFGEEDEEN